MNKNFADALQGIGIALAGDLDPRSEVLEHTTIVLSMLNQYDDQFAGAFKLLQHSRAIGQMNYHEFMENRSKLDDINDSDALAALYQDRMEKDTTSKQWLFISLRDAIITLRNIGIMLDALRDIIKNTKELSKSIDLGAFDVAKGEFNSTFPRQIIIDGRDAVCHDADRMARLVSFKRNHSTQPHGIEGMPNNDIHGMFINLSYEGRSNSAVMTHKGKVVRIEISKDKVAIVSSIIERINECFVFSRQMNRA